MTTLTRRAFFRLGSLSLLSLSACQTGAPTQVMTVWKSPTCGCCERWVDGVRAAGLSVDVKQMQDVDAVRRRERVPDQLASCHTAKVAGYVFEGHVPVDIISTVLKDRPSILGVAVPGMPVGSLGMEGGTPERYQVLGFTSDGATSVLATR